MSRVFRWRIAALTRSAVAVGFALMTVMPAGARQGALGASAMLGDATRHVVGPIPEDGPASAREPRVVRVHAFDHHGRSVSGGVAIAAVTPGRWDPQPLSGRAGTAGRLHGHLEPGEPRAPPRPSPTDR